MILKLLKGNYFVDNRSDATRKGYGSKPHWGAANASNTGGLIDLLNYNITGNPNIVTREPTILPGKVNMSLYRNAKTVLKEALTNEGFVNFVDRLVLGNPKNLGKRNPRFTDPTTYADLKSEAIPRGFVKGNEVAPVRTYPISEEGLIVRNVKPFKLLNPITNEAEAQAARDYLKEINKRKKLLQGGWISALAPSVINGIQGVVSANLNRKSINLLIQNNIQEDKISEKDLYNKYFQEELGNLQNQPLPNGVNASPIYNLYLAHLRATRKALSEKLKNETSLENAKLKSEADNLVAIMNSANGIMQSGLGLLAK